MAEFINSNNYINYKDEAQKIVTSTSACQLRDYIFSLKNKYHFTDTEVYLYNIWMGSLDYCLESIVKDECCRSCKKFVIYCKDADKANYLHKFIRKCALIYSDSELEIHTDYGEDLHHGANWWWIASDTIFINLNKLKFCKEYVLGTTSEKIEFKDYEYLVGTSYGF